MLSFVLRPLRLRRSFFTRPIRAMLPSAITGNGNNSAKANTGIKVNLKKQSTLRKQVSAQKLRTSLRKASLKKPSIIPAVGRTSPRKKVTDFRSIEEIPNPALTPRKAQIFDLPQTNPSPWRPPQKTGGRRIVHPPQAPPRIYLTPKPRPVIAALEPEPQLTPAEAMRLYKEAKVPMTPNQRIFKEELKKMQIALEGGDPRQIHPPPRPANAFELTGEEYQKTIRMMERNAQPHKMAEKLRADDLHWQRALARKREDQERREKLENAGLPYLHPPGPCAGRATRENFRRERKELSPKELAQATYERKWDELLSLQPHDLERFPPLVFGHIPWPVYSPADHGFVTSPDSLTLQAIREFTTERGWLSGRRARIMREILRWHGDKFNATVLPLVLECEKEKVQAGAVLVTQALVLLKKELDSRR